MPQAETRERAHELIDRMAPGQVRAVVGLMEILLDPVSRSLASAPFEDEAISDEEQRAVDASKEWLGDNAPLLHEQVMAELGYSKGLIEAELDATCAEPHGESR